MCAKNFPTVLVCVNCYNKIPKTRFGTAGLLLSQFWWLGVKIRALADSGSGVGCLLVHR